MQHGQISILVLSYYYPVKNSETKDATVENQCLPSNGFMKTTSLMKLVRCTGLEVGPTESTVLLPLSASSASQMENHASFLIGTMCIQYLSGEEQLVKKL